MFYVDDILLKKGIYGIEDCDRNKIIYVGSTKTSLTGRIGRHEEDYKKGNHCNKELADFFENNKYKFVILEYRDNYNNKEILERERYYSEKYHVYEEGYCKSIGGGRLEENTSMRGSRLLKNTDNVIQAKKYITNNWLDKKIDKKDRDEIGDVLRKEYNIIFFKFKVVIKQLEFNIVRYRDQQHWIISILKPTRYR